MAVNSWDWLFVIGGAALALGGCVLLLLALFRDRSRGRARCPKCWYSLAGLAHGGEIGGSAPTREAGGGGQIRCPECGRTIGKRRRLYRTRRRWGWALAAAAVVALGACTTLVPKVRRDGVMSLVSTGVLIEVAPIGGVDGPFGRELLKRAGGPASGITLEPATLTPQQQIALTRRIARGNILARPSGKAWRDSYGAIARKLEWMLFRLEPREGATAVDGSLATELHEALEEMLDIPPLLHVRTRDRWVEGMPIYVQMEVEEWWPGGYDADVEGTWRTADGALSGKINCKGGMDFEVPATGDVTLLLDLHVMQSPYSDGDSRRAVLASSIELQYRTVSVPTGVIPAVTSEELDQHIVSTVTAWWNDRGMLTINPHASASVLLKDMAFGVTAEILHDGRVIGWHKVRWLEEGFTLADGPIKGPIMRGMEASDGDWRAAREYITAHQGTGVWQVRLRSLPEWALQMLEAKRYWDGEVTVPLQFGDPWGRPARAPAAVTPATSKP